MTTRVLHALDALRRNEDGVAGIELGAIAGLLTILVLGMIEYSTAIHQSVQLQQQARVGVEFATKYPDDAAGLEQAITGATSNPSAGLGVTVTQFCECPNGTSADCTGTTCTGGVAPDTFVQVYLSQPARTYLTESGLLPGITLTAAATLRVK